MDKEIRVLLIEDSKTDADLIEGMLKESPKEKFVVEVTNRLIKALERLASDGIDIVLVDLTLPDSLGLDTFGRIHAHAPTVPIVVITSFADETQAIKAFQKGAEEYLIKGQINSDLLARSIRYAIERNKSGMALRGMEEKLKKINKCFLSFSEDPSENIRRLTALFGEMLGATCALYNALDREGMLCSIGQWQTPEGYNPRDNPKGHICYDVITKSDGKVFLVRDLQETEYADTDPNVKRYNLKTYLGYPIKWKNEAIGSLCAVYQQDFVPSEDDLNLMSIIASAIEVEERRRHAEQELQKINKELLASNKRLNQLSLRDLQTGLYNHKYLAEIIDAEYYRTKRYGSPISIILLDIDYFKSINDAYGYQVGDLVLKQLAQKLKKMIRQYDVVVRYGGEEFIIISPGADRAQGIGLARRILDNLTICNFGDKERAIKLKVSMAVVSYPEDRASDAMDLIKEAEQIINKAKEEGGNRICCSLDGEKGVRCLEKYEIKGGFNLLKKKLEKLNKEAHQNLIESIFAFAKTIELKDHYTGEHVEKTVRYATGVARELGLSVYEIEIIRQAAMLHDLGKVGISDKILTKKSKLTKKELEEIRKHPRIAADILRPIHVLNSIIPFILYHHERWDGKGYPSGLKGDDIPLGARIVAIADVYQALISNRPYRKAFIKAEAVKIIKEGSGTQFDPKIVDIFLKILKRENHK